MPLRGFCLIYCYSQELLIFLMLGIISMTQEGKGIDRFALTVWSLTGYGIVLCVLAI